MTFRKYLRKNGIGLMRPYVEGEPLPEGCTVSDTDKANGSPKPGDMVSQNQDDPKDTWLVAKAYFELNFLPDPIE